MSGPSKKSSSSSNEAKNLLVFVERLRVQEEKRSDGLLGERSNERRCGCLATPVLHVTALLLDSTLAAPTVTHSISDAHSSAVRMMSRAISPGV